MTWKKIAEKNTIVPGKGEEFDMDGKKISVFTPYPQAINERL